MPKIQLDEIIRINRWLSINATEQSICSDKKMTGRVGSLNTRRVIRREGVYDADFAGSRFDSGNLLSTAL